MNVYEDLANGFFKKPLEETIAATVKYRASLQDLAGGVWVEVWS